MAYDGYRLKINNTIFNNNDIAKGSLVFGKNQRVAKSWKDISGHTRKVFYEDTKTVIQFSVREHLATDHLTLASYFTNPEVTVEYWDENTDTYQTGDFFVNDFNWGNTTTTPDGPMYAACQITLEEK